MATANSNIKSKIWVKIKINSIKKDRDAPVFPSKVNKRCPAIILAESRIAKVPGRIIFLIVSMQTIKGIKIVGVPCGTKCVNMCWVWKSHPYSIKHIHKGKERDKVNIMWLVLVKM